MKSLEDILKEHRANFHTVVPFHPQQDKLLLMDFTTANKELTEDIFRDTKTFSDYITSTLNRFNAKYGIGGYAEHRTIYSRSKLFGPSPSLPFGKGETSAQSQPTSEAGAWLTPLSGEPEGAEPRRLHLGIDIWGKPLTAVRAPLDGFVHSFAFNNADGDYGATIILNHRLEEISFFTLYGHLSLASIKNLREGDKIKAGDVIAEFGIPQENGNWPPHLHFQIIKDLQRMKGDYPGVCRFSERTYYLSNCPDADLILNMMKYVG